MAEPLDHFFAALRQVRLRPAERTDAKQKILNFAHENAVRSVLEDRRAERMVLHSTQKIGLTAMERNAAFDAIHAFMRANPLESSRSAGFFEGISTFFAFHRLVAALALVTLFAGAGGTVAYAADSAMPGSFLYPVKLNLVEPLHEALLLSAEAKVRWNITKVSRRITEAEHAALEPLDAEESAQLQKRIEHSMEQVEQRIAGLEMKGVAASGHLRREYQVLLKAHTEAAAALESGAEIDTSALQGILENVEEAEDLTRSPRRTTGDTSQEVREEAQEDWDSMSAAVDAFEKALAALHVDVDAAITVEAGVLAGTPLSLRMKEADAALVSARQALHTRMYAQVKAHLARGEGAMVSAQYLLSAYHRQQLRLKEGSNSSAMHSSPSSHGVSSKNSAASVRSVTSETSTASQGTVDGSVDAETNNAIDTVVPSTPSVPSVPGL